VKGAQPAPLEPPTPGQLDLNPSFAPRSDVAIIAFIRRSLATGRTSLCFAQIGKYGIPAPDCKSGAPWDLGGQVNWSPDGSAILVLGSRNGGNNFGLVAFTTNNAFSTDARNWSPPTLKTNASMRGQGVVAGAFSPDGKQIALVSNIGQSDFQLYLAPVGAVLDPAQATPTTIRACQVSWRSDSKLLAVMQANGNCSATATGAILTVDPTSPADLHEVAVGAHPAWQPVPTGG
jgi:hypothetical protein